MVARQGLRAALLGARRKELLLEPWQRMGVCSTGEVAHRPTGHAEEQADEKIHEVAEG